VDARFCAIIACGLFATGCPLAKPTSYHPVLDVRSPERPEVPGERSYAYVVFRNRPDPQDPLDHDLCRKLFNTLEPAGATRRQDVAATYWPTTTTILPQRGACDDILEHYDHDLAADIIRTINAPTEWRVFLYAQSPGPFGAAPGPRTVCVDLTHARHQDNLEQNLAGWRELMEAGPERWRQSAFVEFVHKVLTLMLPEGKVHVDCV
jgi:hypothetical protein